MVAAGRAMSPALGRGASRAGRRQITVACRFGHLARRRALGLTPAPQVQVGAVSGERPYEGDGLFGIAVVSDIAFIL